jgi:Starch binding domain
VLVKLRGMLIKCTRAVIVGCIVCIACAFAARADGWNTQSAVFVSYTPGATSASLTVQQATVLRAYLVSPNVMVRERQSGSDWRTITLAELASGEPITLHLTPAGVMTQIDAEYQLVFARLVTTNNGSIVTTAGAAYKLVGGAASSIGSLDMGTFLKLRVDPQNNTAFDLAASKQPFAGGQLAAPVSVTFVVSVPSNTPPSDIVYLTGDAQSWVPNAVRMTPLSANRWTTTLTLGQGSSLKYKYTRGSWQTAESNPAGIEVPNRSLVVIKSGTSQTVNDTVARWSDLPS